MSLRRLLRAVHWYLREISGEAAYDHHVERHRRLHPQRPVCSRREFERRRSDLAERNPRARCC